MIKSSPGLLGIPRGQRIRAPLELASPSSRHQLDWRSLAQRDASQFRSLMLQGDVGPCADLALPLLERLVKPAPDGGPATLGGFDRAGVLRAVAALHLWPPPEVGSLVLHGAVDPTWAERGIGRALMAWQEGRGRQILASMPGAGQAQMLAYVPEASAGRRRLLMAAGFSTCRSYFRVRRDLQAPIDAVDLPHGLEWRSKDQVGSEQVRQAHNLASSNGWAPGAIFQQLWDQRWPNYRPDWAAFAFDPVNAAVVGYALTVPSEQTWTGVPRQEALIHRLGVVPQYRGRGVGRALLAKTLEAIGQAVEPPRFASCLVDPAMANSGASMLEGLGFSPATRVLVYGLVL